MSSDKTFSIGQIVYILPNKGQTIIPAMVIEEATIQTLNGKKISWKFAVGEPGPKQKIVDSAQFGEDIFTSLDEVKELLSSRLNKFIEKVIDTAKGREEAWFGQQIKMAQQAGLAVKQQPEMDAVSLLSGIDVPNDDITNYFATNEVKSSKLSPQEEARRKLKNMVTPDEEPAPSGPVAHYVDENGNRVKVNLQ